MDAVGVDEIPCGGPGIGVVGGGGRGEQQAQVGELLLLLPVVPGHGKGLGGRRVDLQQVAGMLTLMHGAASEFSRVQPLLVGLLPLPGLRVLAALAGDGQAQQGIVPVLPVFQIRNHGVGVTLL